MTIGTGTLTVANDVTYLASGNPLGATISGGTLDLGNATRNFVINDSSTAAVDFTISSSIANAGVINKSGTGVLTMSGPLAGVNGLNVSGGALNLTGTERRRLNLVVSRRRRQHVEYG